MFFGKGSSVLIPGFDSFLLRDANSSVSRLKWGTVTVLPMNLCGSWRTPPGCTGVVVHLTRWRPWTCHLETETRCLYQLKGGCWWLLKKERRIYIVFILEQSLSSILYQATRCRKRFYDKHDMDAFCFGRPIRNKKRANNDLELYSTRWKKGGGRSPFIVLFKCWGKKWLD